MPGEAQENPVAMTGIVTGVPLENTQPLIRQTAAPAPVKQTDVVQSIVREILVVTEAGGPPIVDVQFNSTTLDGLRVRVSGGKDQIAIQFSTSSESVMHLLKQHVGDLSEALQAKGLHVAPVQIDMRPTAAAVSQQPGSSPRHSRDGQRDAQQEKRQR
jgi:flagellar hook-length control protein FliK